MMVSNNNNNKLMDNYLNIHLADRLHRYILSKSKNFKQDINSYKGKECFIIETVKRCYNHEKSLLYLFYFLRYNFDKNKIDIIDISDKIKYYRVTSEESLYSYYFHLTLKNDNQQIHSDGCRQNVGKYYFYAHTDINFCVVDKKIYSYIEKLNKIFLNNSNHHYFFKSLRGIYGK